VLFTHDVDKSIIKGLIRGSFLRVYLRSVCVFIACMLAPIGKMRCSHVTWRTCISMDTFVCLFCVGT